MTPRAPPQGGLRTLKGCVAACLSLTLAILLISADVTSARRLKPYYGRYIGKFITHAHGVNGTVYAVDESTIFIKGFNYDGMGPATYFWAGDTPRVSPEGFIVPYPDEYTSIDGKKPILSAHSNRNIILRLPNGRKLKDIKWLSVWCQRFTVNFADVSIPPGLEPPRPRVLPEFKRLAHGLRSGNISVLDEKTFYIPNLHYDGAGPDAYFWVGNGSEPSPFGTKVPNEMGSLMPLRGYQGEDIEIQLPSNMTVHDIEWLAVWCVAYKHNFGHVYIPGDLEVPPALGQTKITTSSTTSLSPANAKNINCREFLDKRLQVQWEIQGDYVQITLSARLRKGQYMAFGLSGEDGRAMMLDADVVVAFWDVNINQPRAVDYSITHAAQCDGHRGVCPDVKLNGRDDVILVSGHQKNGITTITYRKPLLTQDMYDKEILRTRNQSVIAAFGPLNSRNEANAHSFMDTTRHDVRIFFADESDNTCSELAELNSAGPKPWPPRIISGVTNFTARIGPDGGKRGYTAITGEPSWGIAWYINDQLIPELYVERGRTYNFIVEGGDDRSSPAKYHPLYISDSPEGGFGQKRPEAQRKQRVFAGVAYDTEGYSFPTGDGRYCEWAHKTIDRSSESETFEQFMETLTLKCEPGEAKVLTWPVEDDTPDLVYYQCFTHNNLGWKIHVLDPGAPTPPSTLSGAAPSLHLSLLSAIATALLLLR